jgi:hypothetical protein
MWTGSICIRTRAGGEHSKDPLGAREGKVFLDQFSDYSLHKKDSVLWSLFVNQGASYFKRERTREKEIIKRRILFSSHPCL